VPLPFRGLPEPELDPDGLCSGRLKLDLVRTSFDQVEQGERSPCILVVGRHLGGAASMKTHARHRSTIYWRARKELPRAGTNPHPLRTLRCIRWPVGTQTGLELRRCCKEKAPRVCRALRRTEMGGTGLEPVNPACRAGNLLYGSWHSLADTTLFAGALPLQDVPRSRAFSPSRVGWW
jgi:hypothetical protein